MEPLLEVNCVLFTFSRASLEFAAKVGMLSLIVIAGNGVGNGSRFLKRLSALEYVVVYGPKAPFGSPSGGTRPFEISL